LSLRHVLAINERTETATKIYSEITSGLSSPTKGDKMVKNLQKVWHMPYEVARILTGNKTELPINAVLKALAIPNLPPSIYMINYV